jgi:hypothetical protein
MALGAGFVTADSSASLRNDNKKALMNGFKKKALMNGFKRFGTKKGGRTKSAVG